MNICNALLCLAGMTQLALPATAVPSFTIDLDEDPKKRWDEVVEHYRTEMTSMYEALLKTIDAKVNKDFQQQWLDAVDFGPEYESELQGIAGALDNPNVTATGLKLMNLIYELESPTACAGVLWATQNGTVMQGRNMDYSLNFNLPDGRAMNWPDVTFEATFVKAGKPVMQSTHWPGSVGVSTAMRSNGWAFQQNTRRSQNEMRANLVAAQQGGKPYGVFARKLMETTADFEEAVRTLDSAKFIAPAYFVLSGAGPYQGVVLTVDRLASHIAWSPPPLRVYPSHGKWHLVQTNDDIPYQPLDHRRPTANAVLATTRQELISEEHLMEFMHGPWLWTNVTVFTTVMVPGTGYFKTALPGESPGPERADQVFSVPMDLAPPGQVEGQVVMYPRPELGQVKEKVSRQTPTALSSPRGKLKLRQRTYLSAEADTYWDDRE